MAARATASGAVSSKADVNEPEASSEPGVSADSGAEESASVEAKSESKNEDLDLDEKDLEEIEAKKVPYSRFKEVNQKAKSAEGRLKELQEKYEAELRRAEENAEIRAQARISKKQEEQSLEEIYDPAERRTVVLEKELSELKGELRSLRSESSQDKLQQTIDRLEAKYPEADTVAVLAIAKHLGQTSRDSIEELMHENHSRNLDRANKQLRQIIEQKKQRQKTAIPTREGGIKLKESDRPKTLKEASAKLSSLFKGGR